MSKQEHTFHYPQPFELEAGDTLPGFQLHYTTLGTLNSDKSNVIWVCHALTGSSDVTSWWPALFGEGSVFDPANHFIICANMLGGCYGSTGPLSVNPETGAPYYHTFPTITNRDTMRAFNLLRQHLALDTVRVLIGGSLGGQQVLEWAIAQPQVFQHIIPIACNALHSPWGIAFNEAQRMAIAADNTWKEDRADAGLEGLKAARAIGMISYRHYHTFQKTQTDPSPALDGHRASSYQQYQGKKLADRFNAFTYWTLSKKMDSHHVGRNREGVDQALQKIKAATLVIGIDSDLLFPVEEQQYLAQHIAGARLEVISSLYGHDGFLVEFEALDRIIQQFLATAPNNTTSKNHSYTI